LGILIVNIKKGKETLFLDRKNVWEGLLDLEKGHRKGGKGSPSSSVMQDGLAWTVPRRITRSGKGVGISRGGVETNQWRTIAISVAENIYRRCEERREKR